MGLRRAGGEGLHPSKALEAARLSDRINQHHIFGALKRFFELLGGTKGSGPHSFLVTYVKVGRFNTLHHEIASWRDELWTFVNIFL